MYYEINVSLNGSHLFATHKRSVGYSNLKKIYKIFVVKFPVKEGFDISITEHPQIGYGINPDTFQRYDKD